MGLYKKELGLSSFKSYLKDELGLSITSRKWRGADSLPLFLSKAASYLLCSCNGAKFIAAEVKQEASLPELKRIASQVSARSDMQVAIVAQIDARQRKALVSQRIPFVVPGRQAFLPMLGFAATAKQDPAPLTKTLAPSTQAVLVALIANPAIRSSEDLMRTTSIPASSVSRALEDLARRGLVEKSKEGREVIIDRDVNKNALVKSAKGCLRMPVVRIIYARKNAQTSLLPLAGESALASRSMLAPPKMEQRAASRNAFITRSLDEVQLGELLDTETVEIQIWSYNPLVAGGSTVDDVSLALSLVQDEDERVIGQLNTLFEEELWQ